MDESDSYADVLRKLNISEHGANRTTLKKIINEYDLDLTKISENRKKQNLKILNKIQKKEIPLEDILNNVVPYKSSKLIKRLFKEGYKEEKCERCGITKWMGEKIVFHLHHEDGDHNNNKITNLKVLCPNCHSQTDNYAGKGKCKIPKLSEKQEKKKAYYGISEDGKRLYDGYGDYKILCPICNIRFMNRSAQMCCKCREKERRKPKVSKEELFKIMETNSYYSAAKLLGVDDKTVSRWYEYYINKERENNNMLISSNKVPPREILKQKIRTMPFVKIGKEYNVTDNAIRKWCDVYGLPRHVSEIKSISDEDWEKI